MNPGERIAFWVCCVELWFRNPPEWFRAVRDILLAIAVIGLVIFCFYQAYFDLMDGMI